MNKPEVLLQFPFTTLLCSRSICYQKHRMALRNSHGLTGAVPGGVPTLPELPSKCMDLYPRENDLKTRNAFFHSSADQISQIKKFLLRPPSWPGSRCLLPPSLHVLPSVLSVS